MPRPLVLPSRPIRLSSLLLGLAAIGFPAGLRADVVLPSIFGSNMVLQRDVPVPVWGTADAGETVHVEIAGQALVTTADTAGRWRLTLAPLAVRETGDLLVRGRNEITLTNVAVGEVWFCSGQSNMAAFLSSQGDAAVASAGDPQLRLYRVTSLLSAFPVANRPDLHWHASTPSTAERFSAQAHYFGRTLRRELGVPVGLIAAAIGASRIEPWIPAEISAVTPELKDASERILKANQEFLAALDPGLLSPEWLARAKEAVASRQALPPFPDLSRAALEKFPRHKLAGDKQQPSTLYNGLVHHLMDFPVRGVIWQQGVANQGDGYGYLPKFKALVEFWRSRWGPATPVYYVQYPATASIGPEFRDVQTAMMQAVPHTAMVTCSDVSTDLDLHPKNKDVTGARLGLLALADTYGKPVKAFTGPLYESMSVEGSQIRVRFRQTGSGLASRDGQPLNWFEIAAEGGPYAKAEARIEGDTVLVWSPNVKAPARVRLGWDPLAIPNLMNQEGLPASIFRSHREP